MKFRAFQCCTILNLPNVLVFLIVANLIFFKFFILFLHAILMHFYIIVLLYIFMLLYYCYHYFIHVDNLKR